MDEIISLKSEQLIEAIHLWSGNGISSMPLRDESRVVRRFGERDAIKLLSVIKLLEDDFYDSDAHLIASNLREMGILVAEDFRSKHPEVADEIIETFAWCYTFDYK